LTELKGLVKKNYLFAELLTLPLSILTGGLVDNLFHDHPAYLYTQSQPPLATNVKLDPFT